MRRKAGDHDSGDGALFSGFDHEKQQQHADKDHAGAPTQQRAQLLARALLGVLSRYRRAAALMAAAGERLGV